MAYSIASCLNAIKAKASYIDPDSVKIERVGNKKMESVEYLGSHIIMYVIPITINAKNRMGGYTGEKLHHCYYSVNTGGLIQTQ